MLSYLLLYFILTTFLSRKLSRCDLPQFSDEQTKVLSKLKSKFPKQISDEARPGNPVQHFSTVPYLRHVSDTKVSRSNSRVKLHPQLLQSSLGLSSASAHCLYRMTGCPGGAPLYSHPKALPQSSKHVIFLWSWFDIMLLFFLNCQ